MKVQVISNASDAHNGQFIGKVAIVIDVIRTSTTIVAALHAGAASVIPVETIMEAKGIRQNGDLLGGERFCKRISDFQLGNSPQDYTSDTVKGKNIILTTTNGTSAIKRCIRADTLLVAGLVNASACSDLAASIGKDIVIVCAGSHDQFTIEDGYCAGLLIANLQQQLSPEKLELDDFASAMLALYQYTGASIEDIVRYCISGRRLLELGLEEDLKLCLETDTMPIVPQYVGGKLRVPIHC